MNYINPRMRPMKLAPKSWLPFFEEAERTISGRSVPLWMTLRHIKRQRKVAQEMQKLLGPDFLVEYSPGGSIDDFNETSGHCIEVTILEIDPKLAFDMRENYREQIADWFADLAAKFTIAAGKIRASMPRSPQPSLISATGELTYAVVAFGSLNGPQLLERGQDREDADGIAFGFNGQAVAEGAPVRACVLLDSDLEGLCLTGGEA